MNSKNSKTSEPHVLIRQLTHKLDLRRVENYTFKTSAPTWNDKLELPDGSYSVSDIQDYFEYI